MSLCLNNFHFIKLKNKNKANQTKTQKPKQNTKRNKHEGKKLLFYLGDVATIFRCWIHVITPLGIYSMRTQRIPVHAGGGRAPFS